MSAPKVSPAGKTGATTGAAASVKLTIDGKTLAARTGETVLEVARREGIDIPALCHIAETAAWGACRLCLVEVEGVDKLQAACTTWVADGLVVKTDTPRVRARRESYLKMYLSDHNAYCEAPCSHACPTHIDIPGLHGGAGRRRRRRRGRHRPGRAALPRHPGAHLPPLLRAGVPTRRRRRAHRHLRPAPRPGRPSGDRRAARAPPGTDSGKRVAVVGAGPAGLSAAWFLTQRGHQVTIYDAEPKAGRITALHHPRVQAAGEGARRRTAATVGRRGPLRGRI